MNDIDKPPSLLHSCLNGYLRMFYITYPESNIKKFNLSNSRALFVIVQMYNINKCSLGYKIIIKVSTICCWHPVNFIVVKCA